jgi:hypothetical protein
VSALDCWNALFEGGNVRVDPPDDAAGDDQTLAVAIARIEADWRLDLAGEPPNLQLGSAVWAVQIIYKACQFLVYREADPDMVAKALGVPCPLPPSAKVCYSVDLALRILPDLFRLARAASPDDVLVQSLARLAQDWPLSSVGIAIEKGDVSAFIDHPSLRQLYADRIIAAGDASRLTDVRVREAVRASVGGYPQLASASIVAALKESK